MTLNKLIQRLNAQAEYYRQATEQTKRSMQARALFVAACTIRVRLGNSARLVAGYKLPPLRSARKFFTSRVAKFPATWGTSPKAGFARALCGFSLGDDAVCIDTWLVRNKIKPSNAIDQWRKWLALFRLVYGDKAYQDALCIHADWLDFVKGTNHGT